MSLYTKYQMPQTNKSGPEQNEWVNYTLYGQRCAQLLTSKAAAAYTRQSSRAVFEKYMCKCIFN